MRRTGGSASTGQRASTANALDLRNRGRTHEHRLPGENPEQRELERGPAPAAGARKVAARLSAVVARAGSRRQRSHGRLPAHRDQRRARRLGQLRLCPHARLPLGHLSRPRRRGPRGQLRHAQGRAGLAGGARRVQGRAAPPDRRPGRHRARLGRAAARPGKDLPVAVRPAQPVPGQRRGRPPPVGDGVPAARLFRPRRPRGGRDHAGTPRRRPGQAAHPAGLQRKDAGLAGLFHVHVLHRPRRQVPAGRPRGVRFRPPVAHLPVHADRGSAPHVRRRDRGGPHHSAHLRGNERSRHR